jgi:xanthine dehydrogenase YagR molybdenum-binding subunit
LPPAPGQFGSHTTASVGSAINDAVVALQQKLKDLAVNHSSSPFSGMKGEDLFFDQGKLSSNVSNKSVSAVEILKLSDLAELKINVESKSGSEKEQFSGKSFCAHFVEVLVHCHTKEIKVSRVVTAVDAGTMLNKKTARSQVYGSVVWGIGIALMEQGIIDHRYGRYVNNNLADYHLPVNADIPHVEVLFIDKPDPYIDPMGSKGLGEIGLVGFTAAVANAVYHATGKRVRDLPITADKLFDR